MNDKPLSNQRLRLSPLVLVELRRFLAVNHATGTLPVRQTPTVLDVYVIIELTGFAGRIPAI